MLFTKSLRAKVLVSAFIPITLALVVVAIIALFAYERVARDVVLQRDAELASVSAARLAEGLSRLSLVLQTIANDDDVQSLELARMKLALEREQNQLFVFNEGVVVYNDWGMAVWSDPFAFRRRGMRFPVPSEFDKVLTTLMPSFSNVFRDETSGEDVVLLTLPIVARGPEFRGAVAGMSTLNSLLLNATYSEVLEITAGSERFAYLVDGNAQVIFHSDRSRLGTDLSAIVPVKRVTEGEIGAVIAEGPEGKTVISGFAPVPDTDWAVITQERWQNVVGPIRDFSRVLLGLLVIGGVLSAALIFFGIGRILRPIKELTRGAQRIAGGDFDHALVPQTRDEIQTLSQQFNTMASALKESYTGLEKKVEERTHELQESEEQLVASLREKETLIGQVERRADQMGAINDVATQVGSILDLDELFPQVARVLKESFSYYSVDIFLLEPESNSLAMKGRSGGYEEEAPERPVINLGEGIVGWVAQTGKHLLANDVSQEPRYLPMQHLRDTRSELAAPILAGDEVVGVLDVESAELNAFDETDLSTLQTLGKTLGMAIENARLFQQTGDLAVLDERNRMAREIHDTLAQGLTGIVLQLEAAEQAVDEGTGAVSDHLNRARGLARESLQEARRSVWGLVPQALEQKSLEAALRGEVHQFSATGAVKPSLTISGGRRNLSSEIQAAILRICQESLTNVRKHSEATEVTVDLVYSSGLVTLKVQDNGLGIPKDSAKSSGGGGGFGITGMEQRAHQLGGTFSVSNNTDRGALVEVKIPLG